MIIEHFFPDRDSLFAALAEECETTLKAAISNNRSATLMVSGGSTPMPLYKKLSELDMAWSNVSVALVDERWVDEDHPGSNEAFVKSSLLQNRATSAKFVAMKTDDETAELGLDHCENEYRKLQAPFDLTILGMGPDGHIASLFPASQGLEAGLDSANNKLCAAIQANQSEVTGELTERMSLSFTGLMHSRQLHLLITGQEKLDVYRQALSCKHDGSMPVSSILHQYDIPVIVYWAP